MLRYLCRKDRLRTLWIDAICVNQQSASEKATQIPCMQTIFKRAMRVLAYLGSSSTKGNFAPWRNIEHVKSDVLGEMLKLRYYGG